MNGDGRRVPYIDAPRRYHYSWTHKVSPVAAPGPAVIEWVQLHHVDEMIAPLHIYVAPMGQ